VKIPSLTDHKVMNCNCSLCTRNGYLNIYPKRENVIFRSGQDNLSTYPVRNVNAHKFCSTCGSSILVDALNEVKGDNEDIIAVNVRMIKDINVDQLKFKYYDGRAAMPVYDIGETPACSDPSMAVNTDPELTSYPANCHCGAVRYTVKIRALADHDIVNCNCSICTRNGYLLVYPKRENVIFHTGFEQLHSYNFGSKKRPHKFCPTCGSSILIDFKRVEGWSDKLAINVRMIRDTDFTKFKYRYFDGKTKLGPEYTV